MKPPTQTPLSAGKALYVREVVRRLERAGRVASPAGLADLFPGVKPRAISKIEGNSPHSLVIDDVPEGNSHGDR